MISIIIPTYEADGRGVEFLDWNLKKISEQVFTDYEILVSDHSLNYDIQKYLEKIVNEKLKYLRCTKKRGFVGANLNYAIQFAKGEIIKPMFMDDYFYESGTLSIVNYAICMGCNWIVLGCNHTSDRINYFNEHQPEWNDDIKFGKNTLSGPSCIAYKKCDIEWDEEKRWLVDCDFYDKLYRKFYKPLFKEGIFITNYIHLGQMTNKLTEEEKRKEVDSVSN